MTAAMSIDTIAGLRARTQPVASLDLLEWAGDDGLLLCRDGVGLAGRGVATVVDPHAAVALLGAIPVDDALGLPGCGPVAMGALPFDPAATGALVVPAEIVGRAADGTCWRTVISGPVTLPGPRATVDGHRSPDGFTLRALPGHDEWRALIERAVRDIERGALEKVVLAREVVVEANGPIVLRDVLARLAALYPSCMVFNVGGFVGASPELLVSRRGRVVRSHPLAGTVAHRGDPAADARDTAALLASAKDREEHQHVVDDVAAALADLCVSLSVPDAPSIVTLRNVSHLGTLVSGVLHAGAAPSALDLVARLHPTPAVAGTPTPDALAWIARHEGLARGRYAGPVGWVDARGDGEWVVGIRSAEIDGATARLFTGVGVVAGSDTDAELAESQLKLQALLAALVRP
jgi:menaquinone-specific isochorismate synthase